MEKSLNEQLFEVLMHTRFTLPRRMHAENGHPMRGPEGHGYPGPGRERREMPPRREPVTRTGVLEILLEEEEGLRQKDIAAQLRINPSSMSELITKLEQDGYVRRIVDKEDHRATRIVLTELGTARGYEIRDEKEERLERYFSVFSEEEKIELIRLLEKFRDNLPEERHFHPHREQ